MTTSYHNHTTWSDGTTALSEMIEAAEQIGLQELGISDHFVLYPGGEQVGWTMPLDRLGDYVGEIYEAGQSAKVTVRAGIEADYFPETVETLRGLLAQHPFDYVIGSVHYLNGFPIDEHRRYWDALSIEQREENWRLYWERIRLLAESRVYDFVGHLDLPKKFGHLPTTSHAKAESTALDAIAAADMAIEINTAGWSLPVQEAYPALSLLRAARERDIPLLINADAHTPAHLTRHFDRARDLAREAGYTHLVRYERRQRVPVPL
jgi:histidinol-phosphatase (PHP family)